MTVIPFPWHDRSRLGVNPAEPLTTLVAMAPPPPTGGKKKGFPDKRVIAGVVTMLVMGNCVYAKSNPAHSDSKTTA